MENDFEEFQDEYSPYIADYPYIGWNNVWGGGGQQPGADIFVPPQKNLSYGLGIEDAPIVGAWLAIPTVAFLVGAVVMYLAFHKVDPYVKKGKAKVKSVFE